MLLGLVFLQPLSALVEFNFKTHPTAYQRGQKLHQATPDKMNLLFFPEPDVSTLTLTLSQTEQPQLFQP